MATTNPKTQTKSAAVTALLNRGKGATLAEICKTTQWQTHSARAFLTGLRKKGFVITREQHGGEGTAYRITQTPDEETQQAAS